MCFATAAAVAGLVGAGVSAYGAHEGGQATANAARYRAQVAKNNEEIAMQNAERAVAAGQAAAATTSLKGAATAGKIRAAQAASGIDISKGSAVGVQASQRMQEKLDTATVLSNAQLQAYGYRTQATGYGAQAGLEEMTAEQAPIGADLAAAGGLLSNASSIGLKFMGPAKFAAPPAPVGGGD